MIWNTHRKTNLTEIHLELFNNSTEKSKAFDSNKSMCLREGLGLKLGGGIAEGERGLDVGIKGLEPGKGGSMLGGVGGGGELKGGDTTVGGNCELGEKLGDGRFA